MADPTTVSIPYARGDRYADKASTSGLRQSPIETACMLIDPSPPMSVRECGEAQARRKAVAHLWHGP